MAELVRIEPSKFCAGEAWFVYDDGRQLLRKIAREESRKGSPAIIRDSFDKPVQSMADGNYYDSKSALAKTYLPSGNPQGERYECIGERVAQPFVKKRSDREGREAAIKRAISEMGM